MKQERYTYKHKPIGQRPYPNEEHYVRVDNGQRRIVVMKTRKGRDGMNFEVTEAPFENHHSIYLTCPDSTADAFLQVVQQTRGALQI